MTGLTHNQFIKLFSDLAIAHKDINSFGKGDLWEYMANENGIDPVTLWVLVQNDSLDGKTDKPKYSFLVMDNVDKGEENEDEVLSDTLRIAKDLVALLRQPYYESFFTFEQNIEFTPFTERFDSEVSGWQFDITFNQPFLYDACVVNIDGLPVVQQGTIYINTNLTVWGQITGNILSQTDLIAYIASQSGGGESLTQTLAIGNTTGGKNIFITPDDAIEVGHANRRIYDNSSSLTPGLIIENLYSNDHIALLDGGGLHLDVPSVELPQYTASRILGTDGSSDMVALDTATYPSLTEVSYVKGVTSAIQTQLNAKQALNARLTDISSVSLSTNDSIVWNGSNFIASPYKIYNMSCQFGTVVLSPIDSNTNYWGAAGTNTLNTVDGIRRMYIPRNGVLTSVIIFIRIASALGTTEACSFYVRLNSTTDVTISTTATMDVASVQVSNTALSQAVTTSDYIEIKTVWPAFATNPTNISMTALITIRQS